MRRQTLIILGNSNLTKRLSFALENMYRKMGSVTMETREVLSTIMKHTKVVMKRC